MAGVAVSYLTSRVRHSREVDHNFRRRIRATLWLPGKRRQQCGCGYFPSESSDLDHSCSIWINHLFGIAQEQNYTNTIVSGGPVSMQHSYCNLTGQICVTNGVGSITERVVDSRMHPWGGGPWNCPRQFRVTSVLHTVKQIVEIAIKSPCPLPIRIAVFRWLSTGVR